MPLCKPAVAAVLVMLGRTASAQTFVPFLESTDTVFYVEKRENRHVLFESGVNIHLVLWQTVDVAIDAGPDAGAKRGHVVTATPGVVLRMFKEASNPVRTPSYMPRVNVQYYWIGPLRPAKDGSGGSAGVWELHGIVGHHSNGQEGCFFSDQKRYPDDPKEPETCKPDRTKFEPGPTGSFAVRRSDAPVAISPSVNRVDGSFSTNSVRVGLNYRRTYARLVDASYVPSKEWSVGAQYEWNFHMDPYIDEEHVSYGRERESASARFAFAGPARNGWKRMLPWTWCRVRCEVDGSIKYIFNAFKTTEAGCESCAIAARSALYFGSGQWGVTLRYYRGQDYYNLAFVENMEKLTFGATFSQDGFFRFRQR